MVIFGGISMIIIASMFKIAFLGSALTIMLLYVWSRRNSYVFMNVLGLFNVQASHLQWILYGFSVLFDDPITADLMGIIIGHIYYSLEAIFPHKRGGFKILKTPKFLHRLLNQTTHYHDDNDTRRHIENWTLLIVDVFFLGCWYELIFNNHSHPHRLIQ
ncbi:unnamed protein product [Rotaria magnacalcarata]|uniref:Derlin n=1 Tax=Rotaria magnacalcarata TaxID=392030 RepID=A0A815P1F9_9BILA|nr:unnamed protein product [Rotaria magnacalcarata]